MATTIKLKNGSGAPLAGDLVAGEPALDLTNKRLYTEDTGGTVIEVGTNPSTIDINAGTIDGTVIGGSSAAAGTFTTFTSTGIDDNATSTAITIDSSENVGIGTSSITTFAGYQTLHFKNTTGDSIQLNETDGGVINQIICTDESGGRVLLGARSNHATGFCTNDTERMRIDSSGRVGIGVTPDAWRTTDSVLQLGNRSSVADLANDAHFSNNAYFATGGTWKAQDTAQATNYYQSAGIHVWRYAGTTTADAAISWSEAMRIDSSGNVGIGTTSPDQKLDVAGSIVSTASSTAGGAFFVGNSAHGMQRGRVGAANVNDVEIHTNGAGAGIVFMTNGFNERARITSGGNVGIGTDSPSSVLTAVTSSNANNIQIRRNSTTTNDYAQLGFSISTGTTADNNAEIRAIRTNSPNAGDAEIAFLNRGSGAGPTERMRIDSSGNLLVGKTAANSATAGVQILPEGDVGITRNGSHSLLLNRLTSDGAIALFRKDGTTVGSIGSSAGNSIFIGSGDVGVRFSDTNDAIYPMTTGGINRDNAIDLGLLSVRFDDIYATNGTIQTSDANEKQDIETLSEAETRVAVAAKALLRKFRWKSAVEEKGDDARIHFGIIAQDLKAAFEAEGLDAGRYAMFIHSTWTDEETGEERSRMGVRYSELLAFIIAAI